MINHFITAHRFLAYVAGACIFALSGYGLKRLAPDRPVAAISSWIFAFLYFAFALATAGTEGAVLGLAVLVGGVVWMARYFDRHRGE